MPFKSALNAAAFFASRVGPKLARPSLKVGRLKLGKGVLRRFRPWRRGVTAVDIGGGLAATVGLAEWERRRIKRASEERDVAVKRFRERLEKYEPPARRKKVPRIKKTS